MGHVFTPKEFGEGRLPTVEGYKTAANRLRERLAGLADDRLVYGASLHGAAMHGDGGVGSDVDVLVITEQTGAEDSLRRLGESVTDSTYAPIEFVPVPRHMAERGLHSLDYLYFNYIKAFCLDDVIGRNPLDAVSPKGSWSNPAQEVEERFLSQLHNFSKQRAKLSGTYDEAHCVFLERLIRQPIHSALDLLRLRLGRYPTRDGLPLSKAGCCNMYQEEFLGPAADDLLSVFTARKMYRDFLAHWEGRTLADYINMLEELDGLYPKARGVIETNLRLLVDNPERFAARA